MKFNTILALVYVFLIINSSILAIKDKASMSRKRHHKSRVSLHKKSHSHSHTHKKSHTKACVLEENLQLNSLDDFFKGIIEEFKDSFNEDQRKTFNDEISKKDDACTRLFSDKFSALVNEARIFNTRVQYSYENLIVTIYKSKLTIELKKELKSNVENPKAFCETSQKMFNIETSCNRLPDNISNLGVCVQAGFAVQANAAYQFFKDPNSDLDKCRINFFGQYLMKLITKFRFDNYQTEFINIFTNIFALMFNEDYGKIEVLKEIINLIMNIQSAKTETAADRKSYYFGRAVGSVFLIIQKKHNIQSKRRYFK